MNLEQLLATLSVDNVEAHVEAGRIVLINRDPQPNETNIPITTDINLLIVDLDSDPDSPPTPSFSVYVDGNFVGAYNGGAFTPNSPWSGSVTNAHSSHPFVGWYVSLQQPSTPILTGNSTVTIRVDLFLEGGFGYDDWGHFDFGHIGSGSPTSISYTFQTQDLIQPKVISVDTIDLFSANVVFDKAIDFDTVSDGTLWNVVRLNEDPFPSVNLDIELVEQVSATTYRVTFNWEQTQGSLYEIYPPTTTADTSGNLIDPEYSSVQFYGFSLQSIEGRNWNFWPMLVPLKNRQEDLTGDLERFCRCFNEAMGILTHDIDRFTAEFDPDTASDEMIDSMLYDLGNPFDVDRLDLDYSEKRKLLRVLISIYKQKGTNKGIEDTIFFFLGEIVTVVDYTSDGWTLGVDELGEGTLAEVTSINGETYDFSSQENLTLKIDNGTEQEIVFNPVDFSVPASGTAQEVVDVINAQISGGVAIVDAKGTPASYTISGSPFSVNFGDTLIFSINGESTTFTFAPNDMLVEGGLTAPELASKFNSELSGEVVATSTDTTTTITLKHTGSDSEIEFIGGTAIAAFGLTPGDSDTGTDAKCVTIYSSTIDIDAMVQVTGGTANTILGFDTNESGGTGGAILAPEESYTLYSFDIETENELSSDMVAIVREIAEYMKPAHTHLINIRQTQPDEIDDTWKIGIGALGDNSYLSD